MKANTAIFLFVLVLWCGSVSAESSPQVDERLLRFATLRRQQTEKVAASINEKLPADVVAFYKAAEAGDWPTTSNAFYIVWNRLTTTSGSDSNKVFESELRTSALEVFGAYEQFVDWQPALLQRFVGGITNAMTAGSVYFGGTEPGRYIVAAVRDVARTPDICVIAQNSLADGTYMEYLRRTFKEWLWLPDEQDVQRAFEQYVTEFRNRPALPDEQVKVVDGRVRVRGVSGVMTINAILAKAIFDRNKDKHAFYVEESYVIPWMQPYLEPAGFILKLNKEPLPTPQQDGVFWREIIARDKGCWDQLTRELEGDPEFLRAVPAQTAFAKLRSAIGGIYEYRRLNSEAEYAFQQARRFCPASPEPNFRLAKLYLDIGRTDDALSLLREFRRLDPGNGRIAETLEQIETLKRKRNTDLTPR